MPIGQNQDQPTKEQNVSGKIFNEASSTTTANTAVAPNHLITLYEYILAVYHEIAPLESPSSDGIQSENQYSIWPSDSGSGGRKSAVEKSSYGKFDLVHCKDRDLKFKRRMFDDVKLPTSSIYTFFLYCCNFEILIKFKK